jgi:transposase
MSCLGFIVAQRRKRPILNRLRALVETMPRYGWGPGASCQLGVFVASSNFTPCSRISVSSSLGAEEVSAFMLALDLVGL